VIARVFEVMAMRMVPVMNRLPGLDYLGFEEGRHYLGFSSMEEAVVQVQWVLGNKPFAQQIANQAYQFVHEHGMTWDNRVKQILHDVKLI
jgi:spore maturation protein CgeB